MIGYVSPGQRPTREQRQATERMVRCIGYDPLTMEYYIDKKFEGVPFRLYSIYKFDVEKYVRGKMKRRHWGFFKKFEYAKQRGK